MDRRSVQLLTMLFGEGVYSDPTSDPFGMNQTCDRCGAIGNWDDAYCTSCNDEVMMCPACEGSGVLSGGTSPVQCSDCGGVGEVSRFKDEGISANGVEGLGGHGEGFEQQNDGEVRRWPGEGPKVQEGAVDDMKRAVGKMERSRDRLKKKSEQEKAEHPWMSDTQASRVAKDHERVGESVDMKFTLKEFFLHEMPIFKRKAGSDDPWTDQATGQQVKQLPHGNSDVDYDPEDPESLLAYTGQDALDKWTRGREQRAAQWAQKNPKPSLEQVKGKYLHVSQHSGVSADNWNDLTDADRMGAYVSDRGGAAFGEYSLLIRDDGSFEEYDANIDSSG